MGDNFQIWYQGKPMPIAGTSASAPTFASVIALLNDIRVSQGEKPLGFLNPWLYSQGKTGLNDITVGNNPGCGTPGFNVSVPWDILIYTSLTRIGSFQATKGWDPITGLGTPDFGKLGKLLPYGTPEPQSQPQPQPQPQPLN
jgi:tripeptidyl-peptidase-1